MRIIAALYLLPRSIYSSLPGIDCWDAARDATTYLGPHPIVAHPPCGPWGRYAHKCRSQDKSLALRAYSQLLAYGGVLEHPDSSQLMHVLSLPRSGPSLFGPCIVKVRQCDFGHPAEKPTTLIFHRCMPEPMPPPRNPTRPLEHLSHRARSATPPDFATWLAAAARRVS